MREAYGLEGVPLVIDFVPRSGYRGKADQPNLIQASPP